MRLPSGLKNEIIRHLEYCLRELLMQESIYNEHKIRELRKYIFSVIYEMEKLDAGDAIRYYLNHIDENKRKELAVFNVELKIR